MEEGHLGLTKNPTHSLRLENIAEEVRPLFISVLKANAPSFRMALRPLGKLRDLLRKRV